MTTKISTDNIQSSTLTSLSSMRISNVSISNSTYTVLDDTAVNVGGGYIVVTGSGFQDGATVLINETQATAVSFVDSTELHVQVPAKSAATYNLYVVNPDGATAIRVNGLTYSGVPTWVTTSPLTGQDVDVAFSIAFDATGATSYSNTTALPAGTTLLSNGYFYGTITGIETETTYNFTVRASDAENQDADKTFEVTVSVITPDTYFNSTVLLLQGDGTNNAENETFVDSGNNTYSITRGGSVTQGSFSPFSPTGWSAYFDGNGDYLLVGANTNLALSTLAFTVEGWVNFSSTPPDTNHTIFSSFTQASEDTGLLIYANSTNIIAYFQLNNSSSVTLTSSTTYTIGQWYHVTVIRDSSNNVKLFINGQLEDSDTCSYNLTTQYWSIGRQYVNNTNYPRYLKGYVSNFRVIKGNNLYSSNFTVPDSNLTAISNTQLLICQSNRFIDTSNNNFTISRYADAKIESFSPFAPTEAYSPTTHGGSAYFDGTDDYLEWTGATVGTNSFTFETWFYPTISNISYKALTGWGGADSGYPRIIVNNTTATIDRAYIANEDFTVSIQSFAWNHIVMVRDSSIGLTVFVNGVRSSTGVNAGAATVNYQTFNRIGWSNWDPDWLGYLAGTKFVVGTATYSPNASTITVPTAPPSITTNTNLLLKYANAGIYDATAKNILETVGNAKISTSVKKYGTGSMAFDGTGDYLYSLGSNLLTLGTGDFTIEMWARFTSVTTGVLLDMRPSNTNGSYPALALDNGTLIWYISTASRITSGSVNTNTWYHIAVSRASGSTKMFIDGSQAGSTYSDSNNYSFSRFSIGASSFNDYADGLLNGYIDDYRITKGVARYTTTFTPPAKAFTPQ